MKKIFNNRNRDFYLSFIFSFVTLGGSALIGFFTKDYGFAMILLKDLMFVSFLYIITYFIINHFAKKLVKK